MEEKELAGSEMVKKKKTGYNPGRRWIIWGLGSGGRHGEKGEENGISDSLGEEVYVCRCWMRNHIAN